MKKNLVLKYNPSDLQTLRERKDIKELLTLPDTQFDQWYSTLRTLCESKLYEENALSSIPDLSNPIDISRSLLYNKGKHNHFLERIQDLESALSYLDLIKSLRK